MEKIEVINVEITSGNIIISYSVTQGLQRYFEGDLMTLTYSDDISDIPENVAVIPFIANVLPLVWITDATLIIPSIDKTFFTSILEFKKGYEAMYPMFRFGGTIRIGKIEENNYDSDGTLALFSGGVDAFATLIAHIDRYPILFTLWGADVKQNDHQGWGNVLKLSEDTAKQFGLSHIWVKTNFRTMIKEEELDQLVSKSMDGWWHGFQHGISIIAHTAPIAFKKRLALVYIASSFTPSVAGKITCASDPTIDNYVRFGSTSVVHDQYEYSRQEKISHICDFVKSTGLRIKLRVCWQSSGGRNCCQCEKCYRTIAALLAEGCNPNDYGFMYDVKVRDRMIFDLTYSIHIQFSIYWDEIKNRANNNVKVYDDRFAKWICNYNFEHVSSSVWRKKWKRFAFYRLRLKDFIRNMFAK